MNEPIVTLLCVEQYYNIIARVEPGILWTGAKSRSRTTTPRAAPVLVSVLAPGD